MKRIIPIVMAISLIAAAAAAGPEPGALPGGKWWHLPEPAEKLGLTALEQDQLDAAFNQNRRNMLDLKNRFEKARLELELLMETPNFDETVWMEQFNAVSAARTDLARERFRFALEVRKILGHDRFQMVLARYRQIRHERHRQIRERFGGPPSGPPDAPPGP